MVSKQEFLKRVEEKLKYVPRPVYELAENQDLLKQMNIMVMKNGALSEETRIPIALSAATALECKECIKEFKDAALTSGIPQKKVSETILLAGFIATSCYVRMMALLNALMKKIILMGVNSKQGDRLKYMPKESGERRNGRDILLLSL